MSLIGLIRLSQEPLALSVNPPSLVIEPSGTKTPLACPGRPLLPIQVRSSDLPQTEADPSQCGGDPFIYMCLSQSLKAESRGGKIVHWNMMRRWGSNP